MPLTFPFSFTFSVPGISNPFLSAPTTYNQAQAPSRRSAESVSIHSNDKHDRSRVGPIYRRGVSPRRSSPQPLARKRGWVPSISEPSQPATVPTSTSGYLDTPAKYRDMARSHEEDEVEEMVGDIPAPKRRKTLAGSIVSTALSAALIGTAVGLTVYRLWRNRGKQPEALAPPPYEQGNWVRPEEESQREETPVLIPEIKATPATPRAKRSRHVAGRRTPRHRKTPSRPHTYSHTPRSHSPVRAAPIVGTPNAMNVDEPEPRNEVEEQIDWMSDRLAQLIEEGKRALGKEVVVMSESKEDEVDDGSGAWVEDQPLPTSSSTGSFSGSMRRGRTRPRHLPIPSYSPPSYGQTPSPFSSPRKDRFDVAHSRQVTESPQKSVRGLSVESNPRSSFLNASQSLNEDAFLSPEVRESMERARMLYRQRQGQS